MPSEHAKQVAERYVAPVSYTGSGIDPNELEILHINRREQVKGVAAAIDAATSDLRRELSHECPHCQMELRTAISQDGCVGCEVKKLRERLADVTLLASLAHWATAWTTEKIIVLDRAFPCQFDADGLPILDDTTRAALTAAKGEK